MDTPHRAGNFHDINDAARLLDVALEQRHEVRAAGQYFAFAPAVGKEFERRRDRTRLSVFKGLHD